jgi:hypothetical protein
LAGFFTLAGFIFSSTHGRNASELTPSADVSRKIASQSGSR